MTHRIDCPPTLASIAALMGVHLSTVKRAAHELQAKEYLVITKHGTGRYLYMFRAPQLRLDLAFADAKQRTSEVSRVVPQRGSEVSRVVPHYSNDVVSNNDDETSPSSTLEKTG